MSERGVIFADWEVRTTLDGRKTMFRRPIKLLGHDGVQSDHGTWRLIDTRGVLEQEHGEWRWQHRTDLKRVIVECCPFGRVGDRLRVVELRAIPDVDEKYLAGSDGRIYSNSGGNTNAKREKPFALKSSIGSVGYPVVTLTGSVRGSSAVHSLVCSAFHGPAPSRTHVVRHLDGSRDNNDPRNLRWGTKAENESDKRRHRTLAHGERQGSSKLTEDNVDLIRRAVSAGIAFPDRVAEVFNVESSVIRRIVNGNSWRGIGEVLPAPVPEYTHLDIEIVDVSVQRLNDISEDDARAEGVEPHEYKYCAEHSRYRMSLARAWDLASHGKRHPWASNPWVFAVSFKRVAP